MDVFLLSTLEYFKSYLENDYFIIGFEGGKTSHAAQKSPKTQKGGFPSRTRLYQNHDDVTN